MQRREMSKDVYLYEAEETIEDAIYKSDNPKEGETYRVELALLKVKEKADANVKLFDESAAKKDGLCCKGGEVATKCTCSFDRKEATTVGCVHDARMMWSIFA